MSLVTQTHSSHASGRVWWTPVSSLVQTISRIWGALMLYWLVVNKWQLPQKRHEATTLISQKYPRMHCWHLLYAVHSTREKQFWSITFENLRVMVSWRNGRNCHPLCSYSPSISRAFNTPQILGIGWTRLDEGVHLTLSNADETKISIGDHTCILTEPYTIYWARWLCEIWTTINNRLSWTTITQTIILFKVYLPSRAQ